MKALVNLDLDTFIPIFFQVPRCGIMSLPKMNYVIWNVRREELSENRDSQIGRGGVE